MIPSMLRVSPGVELLEKFLCHGAVSLESEDHHSHVSGGGDLKPVVRPHYGLKFLEHTDTLLTIIGHQSKVHTNLSQPHVLPDHVLKTRDSIVPQHKPEL